MKTKKLNAGLVQDLTKILIAVCLLVVAFSSCKKDDNEEEDKSTNTELVCKVWTVVTINDSTVFEFDELQEMTFGFESDGDFKQTAIFDVDDIEEYYGTWKWQYNEESIYIDTIDDEDYFITIIKLTKNEFWFERNDYGTYLIKCVPK